MAYVVPRMDRLDQAGDGTNPSLGHAICRRHFANRWKRRCDHNPGTHANTIGDIGVAVNIREILYPRDSVERQRMIQWETAAAAFSPTSRPSAKRERRKGFRISGVRPVAISSAMRLPETGPALKP